MNQVVIQVEGLSASYGRGRRRVQALRDVDLEVRAGEIFGLLGPNGAGKTTLLACVEGLHKPTEGRVRIDGVEVDSRAEVTKGKLGIQLQHTALLDDLTVGELVEVYAALYGVFLSREQVSGLLERLDLGEERSRVARRLSGGQKQRLALALSIALSLIHI